MEINLNALSVKNSFSEKKSTIRFLFFYERNRKKIELIFKSIKTIFPDYRIVILPYEKNREIVISVAASHVNGFFRVLNCLSSNPKIFQDCPNFKGYVFNFKNYTENLPQKLGMTG